MGEKAGWIALGVVVALLVLGGSCLCVVGGGLAWLVSGAEEADAAGARAQREGLAAGPTMSGEQCFRTALDRRLACGGYIDTTCGITESEFLGACLQTAREVEPSLCEGVPTEGFWDTTMWGQQLCTARGQEAGGPCEDLTGAIAAYCRAR